MHHQYRPAGNTNSAFAGKNEAPCSSYGIPNAQGNRFQVPFPPSTGPPPQFQTFPPPVGPPPIIPPQNAPMILPPSSNIPPAYNFIPPPSNNPPTTVVPRYNVPPAGIIHPSNFNVPPSPSVISHTPFPLTNSWNVPPPPIVPQTSVSPASSNVGQQIFTPALNVNPVPPGPCPPPNFNIAALQTVPNVSFPPPSSCLTTELQSCPVSDVNESSDKTEAENVDELWVKNWLSARSFKKTSKRNNEDMTVCSARILLKDALHTLSELKMAAGFLRNSTNVDDEMWQFKLRKTQKLKDKLNSLIMQFSSGTVASLKKRVKRIHAKRERLKRQRLSAEENNQLEVQNREKVHAIIDAWRNEIQEKVLGEKKKEELKTEADNVLSEVRRKVQEGKKVLEQLEVLERLRSARLESSEKKGLKVSSGSTEHFIETIQKVRKLMTRQLKVYEAEEHALKVMLETEREQEKQDREQKKMEFFKRYQEETLQRLFGTPPEPSSPLYLFWQYYMQGHTDLELLVQIRQHWDMFLTPQDNPDGSPVPIGWVLPEPPSSKDWKCCLDSCEPS